MGPLGPPWPPGAGSQLRKSLRVLTQQKYKLQSSDKQYNYPISSHKNCLRAESYLAYFVFYIVVVTIWLVVYLYT